MAKKLDRKVYQGINRAMTPDFDRWAKKNHHISGKKLLAKVASAEGGGTTQKPNTSSAGARGPFQFIPSTRSAYIKQHGVDAWKTNTDAAKAAMIHLKGTGIKGYNPGMSSYTNLVLGQDVDTGPLKTGRYGSGKVAKGKGAPKPKPKYTTDLATTKTKGVDNSALRSQVKLDYLSKRGKPGALLEMASGLQAAADVPGETRVKQVRKKVPASGGKGGAVKRNSKGLRTSTNIERIAAKAKSMGLRVGGNSGVNAGHARETSGHTSGSNHYANARKKGWQGALDISGDPKQMAKLAGYLSKRYGKDMEELIYRGPGSRDSQNIKRGKRVGRGFYTAHTDHVHAADLDG